MSGDRFRVTFELTTAQAARFLYRERQEANRQVFERYMAERSRKLAAKKYASEATF